MAEILIKEVDNTTTGTSASTTEIVFIPGFSITSSQYQIFTSPIDFDSLNLQSITQTSPQYVINYSTRQLGEKQEQTDSPGTFKYTEITYVEPTFKENTPILCNSLSEFRSIFGDTAYVFPQDIQYTQSININDEPTEIGFDVSAYNEGDTFIKAGDLDKSYIMASELLNQGMSVVYYAMGFRDDQGLLQNPTLQTIYANISDLMEEVQDKGEYDFKYFTTGGYPIFEYNDNSLVYSALELAGNLRGDCIALIDHTNKYDRSLSTVVDVDSGSSVYVNLQSLTSEYLEYGAMYTPYAFYVCTTLPSEQSQQILPASFGYLRCLAKSVKNNPDWYAISGVSRGLVPNIVSLYTMQRLTNKIADDYQPRDKGISLNAITNIKPYGLTIWGNRTLKQNIDNLVATSFVNIRNLVSDVKKTVYKACKKCMFEQNSDLLWLEFMSMISPLLDQMVSGQGLKSYKILQEETDEKAKLVAKIILVPIYALESIEVTIVLQDDDVTVS